MRCSNCFGELKEGPDGLRCDACDTTLQPLIEGQTADDGSYIAPPVKNRLLPRIIALVGGLALAATLALIFLKSPRQQAFDGKEEAPSELTVVAETLVLTDPSSIVRRASRQSSIDGQVTLFMENRCQNMPGGSISSIGWRSLSEENLFQIAPSLPANWDMQIACPTTTNTLIAGALLSDGVAISSVLADGTLAWTRILPANQPTADSFAMQVVGEDIVVVSPDVSSKGFVIAVYSLDGARMWQRAVSEVSPVGSPQIAANASEAVFVAVNAMQPGGTISAELLAVSVMGDEVYETGLQDRSVPIAAIAVDPDGGAVLMEGRRGLSLQAIAEDGSELWRRWVSADEVPIGVISNGSNYLFASTSGRTLLLRSARKDGAISNPIELDLVEDIDGGSLTSVNDEEAIMTLHLFDQDAPIELVLDLTRLVEAVTFDEVASDLITASEFGDPAFSSAPSNENAVLEPLSESIPDADAPDDAEIETIDANVVDEGPQTVAITLPEPSKSPATPGADLAGNSRVEPDPVTDVQCTFVCASLEDNEATYTLMQSVALQEGETPADVSPRMRDTHVLLCDVSGGQPVAEFTRNCTAQ